MNGESVTDSLSGDEPSSSVKRRRAKVRKQIGAIKNSIQEATGTLEGVLERLKATSSRVQQLNECLSQNPAAADATLQRYRSTKQRWPLAADKSKLTPSESYLTGFARTVALLDKELHFWDANESDEQDRESLQGGALSSVSETVSNSSYCSSGPYENGLDDPHELDWDLNGTELIPSLQSSFHQSTAAVSPFVSAPISPSESSISAEAVHSSVFTITDASAVAGSMLTGKEASGSTSTQCSEVDVNTITEDGVSPATVAGDLDTVCTAPYGVFTDVTPEEAAAACEAFTLWIRRSGNGKTSSNNVPELPIYKSVYEDAMEKLLESDMEISMVHSATFETDDQQNDIVSECESDASRVTPDGESMRCNSRAGYSDVRDENLARQNEKHNPGSVGKMLDCHTVIAADDSCTKHDGDEEFCDDRIEIHEESMKERITKCNAWTSYLVTLEDGLSSDTQSEVNDRSLEKKVKKRNRQSEYSERRKDSASSFQQLEPTSSTKVCRCHSDAGTIRLKHHSGLRVPTLPVEAQVTSLSKTCNTTITCPKLATGTLKHLDTANKSTAEIMKENNYGSRNRQPVFV